MIDLNFTDITKPATHVPRKNPLDVFRNALQQQIDACLAAQAGKTYTVKRRRYTNGVDHHIEVPLRPWWFEHEGEYLINLKYSSQTVSIKSHPTIRAGISLTDVEAVLTTVLTAIEENDPDIVNAVDRAYQKTRWKKTKGAS